MSLILSVEGFSAGAEIPRKYTCAGANQSPALTWSDAPSGAKSFALILDDPDAPGGVWNHWLVWNIPITTYGLAENIKLRPPVCVGANDFGEAAYGGPCPPKGHGPHRYFFRLFALDIVDLALASGARRAELDRILNRHVLAHAESMGRFERK